MCSSFKDWMGIFKIPKLKLKDVNSSQSLYNSFASVDVREKYFLNTSSYFNIRISEKRDFVSFLTRKYCDFQHQAHLFDNILLLSPLVMCIDWRMWNYLSNTFRIVMIQFCILSICGRDKFWDPYAGLFSSYFPTLFSSSYFLAAH